MRLARERSDRLELLVNNAGIAPRERRDILESSEESFDELIGINLKGPHFLTQLAARWMLAPNATYGYNISNGGNSLWMFRMAPDGTATVPSESSHETRRFWYKIPNGWRDSSAKRMCWRHSINRISRTFTASRNRGGVRGLVMELGAWGHF